MINKSYRRCAGFLAHDPAWWLVACILLIFSLLIVAIQLHFYNWPMNLDMTIYACTGHEMLHGRLLYTDVWDLKPPAVYVTYALFEYVLGYGPQMFTCMTILSAILIMLGIYAAGVASGLGSWAGLLGAALWTIQCGDIPLELYTPNTEYFINVLIVWSFAGMLMRINGRLGWLSAAGIGGEWLLATLFKHSIVLSLIPLALCYVYVQWQRKRLKMAIRDVITWLVIGMVGWLAVFGYFAIQGRVADVYFTLVTFCQYYGGTVFGNLVSHSTYNFFHQVTSYFKQFNTLFVLNLIGLIWATQKRRWPLSVIWLGWLMFAYVAAFSLFNDYEHYLQYWIPALSMGAGFAIYLMLRYPPRMSRWVILIGTLFYIGALVHTQLPSYAMTLEQAVKQSQQRAIDYQAQQLGTELSRQLAPDDYLFLWGYRTDVLFYAKCRITSGVLMANHAVESPYAQKLTQMIFDNLEKYPPKYVVTCDDWLKADKQRLKHPVTQWVIKHCQRLAISDRYPNFSVWKMRSPSAQSKQ